LNESVSQEKLLALIDTYNEDPAIDGISRATTGSKSRFLRKRFIRAVLPEKDVDGFSPVLPL
jgi:methylenetetrahydrofolate dehydrogenase (NADP+)/methenyltetrahydrofolate cyclohydrolase